MLKAILFDMDGVLVDTEELTFRAARQMFEEHGIAVTNSFSRNELKMADWICNSLEKYPAEALNW